MIITAYNSLSSTACTCYPITLYFVDLMSSLIVKLHLQHIIFTCYCYCLSSVTDPPLNANATRTGLTSLTVRWSPPPPPLSSPLLGYEVFYAYNATVGEGEVKEMRNSVLVSNVTYQVVLDQLLFDKNYQIFVVAFGGDLPSQRSNTITTSTGKAGNKNK